MRSDMPKLLVHTSRRGGPKNDDALRVRRTKVRAAKVTRWELYQPDPDDPEDMENDYAFVQTTEWEEVSEDDKKVVCRGKTAMRQRRYGKNDSRKEFGENLKPLARYLMKQAGRPWDKVYSEIREVCEPTGTVNAHIYQHLWDMVKKDVFVGPDGKIWERPHYGPETPLTCSPGSWWRALYIHPVTGLLCKTPHHNHKRYRRPSPMDEVRKEDLVIIPKQGKVWASRKDEVLGSSVWFELTLKVSEDGAGAVPLSENDLRAYLKRKGFQPKAVEEAVDALVRPHRNPLRWSGGYRSRTSAPEFVRHILGIELRGPVPHSEVG